MLTAHPNVCSMANMENTVGENLLKLRTAAKLSRERLGGKCVPPLSSGTIYGIENGKTPDPGFRTMDNLCRALGVTRRKLLGSLHE